jgi:ABC-type xylose transport system substrate-binding protein
VHLRSVGEITKKAAALANLLYHGREVAVKAFRECNPESIEMDADDVGSISLYPASLDKSSIHWVVESVHFEIWTSRPFLLVAFVIYG